MAAIASLAIAATWYWAARDSQFTILLQGTDLVLAALFGVEFFTRTGWQRSQLTYAKWRWFDFFAILPITVLGPLVVPAVFWIVLSCRSIRLVDRILGDGFVQRTALLLVVMAEEELSDRILEKMLTRWDRELHTANFGTAMAHALKRNKEAVLRRVFAEQLQDGTFAKIAHFTGLQATIEKEEARLFSGVIEMVGSPEVDEAIRDVISSALRRATTKLHTREWQERARIQANLIRHPEGLTAIGTIRHARLPDHPGPPRPTSVSNARTTGQV